MSLDSFLEEVRKSFPADFLSQTPDDLEAYGRDWTRKYAPRASAIAFPRTTEEVARFLGACSGSGVAVVPSGGRTGLAGGAVATSGEVVLSLARMNHLGPVDPLSQTVRVQAGAVTEAVHEHCKPHGLTWPIDFASKGSSQVGGNISTNAGGVKVIRYGLTRNWVLGLQVVTMNGDVLELNGALEKNNTGTDLRQLFIGSEGTLGVITEATLKLTRLPGELSVYFFAVKDVSAVFALFQEVRRAPFGLMAFECLGHNCLEVVTEHLKTKSPFEGRSEFYVLVEVERPATAQGQATLDAWLERVFKLGLVQDGTLAQSPREACELWRLREGLGESIMSRAYVHKNDISLPIAGLEVFLKKMSAFYADKYPDFEVYVFGHIGDGNLHVNVMQPASVSRKVFDERCRRADSELFALLRDHHGSVSAEHGIGLLKKEALPFSRTPVELELLRALKRVFDPKGLLNPGKIFD